MRAVYDPPESTEKEQEQPLEWLQDEDGMSGTGHDDPERKLKPDQGVTNEPEDE